MLAIMTTPEIMLLQIISIIIAATEGRSIYNVNKMLICLSGYIIGKINTLMIRDKPYKHLVYLVASSLCSSCQLHILPLRSP